MLDDDDLPELVPIENSTTEETDLSTREAVVVKVPITVITGFLGEWTMHIVSRAPEGENICITIKRENLFESSCITS